MKRFINDLKKYKNYILYATKAELKTEVINSYLGFIWLFLEPLCFMLIYTFIAQVIFGSKGISYFPVFVFYYIFFQSASRQKNPKK
jgi:ABC-type polysaccharide/polyol phosphate export permease